MRRIQVVMDPDLDERLMREAAARRMSKSALVRECVERGLRPEDVDNGLRAIGALAPLFAGVEFVDIDTELYGPVEAES